MFSRSNKAVGDGADSPPTGYDDTSAVAYDSGGGLGSHNIDTSDNSTMDPDSGVKRGLKNHHLSMMALAGIIGPGLLVGAGGALNSGGPASLLIGFGVIGMCFSCLHALSHIPQHR